jgi:serine/threonine protein kinase/Ca2+-binding EF-hand superfamily protein
MLEVNGISGVVQTFGHFPDTVDGLIPDKVFKEKHSVIVMELLEGGHMLSRVNSQRNVSEHYIALAFKRLIVALDSLHRKQFIHRDVKLENIMFLDQSDYSPVKIIDLGMMVHCAIAPAPPTRRFSNANNPQEPNYNFIYQDKRCRGTPGYVAPESITSYQYSPKTDLWQAGCVLYSLLSGMPAFNPNIPEQATDMTYFPMRGNAWDNVSDLGKDLVSKILKRDPKRRLTSPEILDHPWILGHAPSTSLGEDYLSRIKQLVLRQRLKAFFVDNKIEKHSKERRQHLEEVLPFLTQYAGMRSGHPSNRGSPSTDRSGDHRQSVSCETVEPGNGAVSGAPAAGASGAVFETPEKRPLSVIVPGTGAAGNASPSSLAFTPEKEFRDKLRTLKIEVIRSVSLVDRAAAAAAAGLGLDGDDREVAETMAMKKTEFGRDTTPLDREKSTPVRTSGLRVRHINYETFVSLLDRCELPELANRQVFNIFDWKNLGTIDMKEFLMTMLAFQPLTDLEYEIDEHSGGGGGGGDGSGAQENSCSFDSKENSKENDSRGGGMEGERFSGGSSSDRFPVYSVSNSNSYLANKAQQQRQQQLKQRAEIDEEARLYFRMFDVYERGYLSLEDLKIGIDCILYDATDEESQGHGNGNGQDTHRDDGMEGVMNIEALFDAIDVSGTGKIEFKEFVVFYRNLLTQTMGAGKTRRIRSRSRSMDPTLQSAHAEVEEGPLHVTQAY